MGSWSWAGSSDSFAMTASSGRVTRPSVQIETTRPQQPRSTSPELASLASTGDRTRWVGDDFG